jgi:hypothetical protein
MQTTRRHLFKFVGGSAVGAFLTPAPWRLITDTALWSENWPGIPRPARGEIRARYTNCSLCPAGCAVRARCVGDQPVSLAGVKNHPLSQGALCPWGIAAHHLPYHPARLRHAAGTAEATIREAMSRCRADERVAVLDLRPGRTASWTYRRAMAALPNGAYLANPAPDWAFDLQAARTVLSLGAPLADGWGTPGNVFAARGHMRLIHADAVETRTASWADLWLPIRAESEAALALAAAGEMPAAEAARETGLPEQLIREVMAELRTNGPSLVLGRTLTPELMRANIALGAPGKTIVPRGETPAPKGWAKAAPVTALDAVPDGSIRVLFIDESAPGEYIPWPAIAPKLAAASPLVVAFAWNEEGYGKHANFTLPAPVCGESLDDIPAAADGVTAAFRLAVPMVNPPAAVVNPAEFIGKLAGLDAAQAFRERADAIHQTGRGQVFTPEDGKTAELKSLSADEFWKALNAGACWMSERENGAPDKNRLMVSCRQDCLPHKDLPLAIVAGESAGPPLTSPLSSKLYRESNLRQSASIAAMAPATAHAAGLANGSRAVLQTATARLPVVVAIDPGLPPDVVRIAAGAGLCDLEGGPARGKVVAA